MLNAKGTYNCPNCGAPITAEKCPYCGTLFYDFSTIEVGKPSYIKIKHKGKIVMCKAFLTECSFNLQNQYAQHRPLGALSREVIVGQTAEITMGFSVASDENGRLFTAVEV